MVLMIIVFVIWLLTGIAVNTLIPVKKRRAENPPFSGKH